MKQAFDDQVSWRNWPDNKAALADFYWCKDLIRVHSGSFYRAFKHLRRDKALAVFAIYAFCRTADDAVDEHKDAAELYRLSDQLTAFAAGRDFDDPMWRSLRLTFNRFDLDVTPYQELLSGLRMDLNPAQPANQAELDRYCYLVAGTVGLMLCPLLAVDPQSQQAQAISVKLGLAMQLTNILRDVGTDNRLGRTYLPKDLILRYKVSDSDLAEANMSAPLIELWEHLAHKAEDYYREVEQNLDLYERSARLPLLLSLEYYRSIINACRKSGYDLLQNRIYVPNWQKAIIYWRVRLSL